MEKTIVIIKPDALQRNLFGNIISRFESKGLKIVGLKMIRLDDVLLEEHYIYQKDKPFFSALKNFMKKSPVIVMVLEGLEAVKVVRMICGKTSGREADVGTIRGDLSMSTQTNIIHASDSPEVAQKELAIFFKDSEIFNYLKIDFEYIYGEEERNNL